MFDSYPESFLSLIFLLLIFIDKVIYIAFKITDIFIESSRFYNLYITLLFPMLKKLYRIFAVPLFQDNYSYVVQGSKPN